MRINQSKSGPLILLAALLLGIIVAFHIGLALTGRPMYRPTHIGTALQYARHGIDLLNPVIIGFNAGNTPTLQEFPLWQALTALAFQVSHSRWLGWGNLVSLALFMTCLWPLFSLACRHLGERAAGWTLAFFLAQPLVVVYAGEASPDGLSLAAVIWFMFAADRMFQTGALRWCLAATLAGTVAALTKLPFFMTAGLCAAFLLAGTARANGRAWGMLAAAGCVAAAAFFAWTARANTMAAAAEYPYVEMRLSESPFLRYWFFGDLAYRLSPGHWVKGGWRFLHGTLGSLPFLALVIAALLRSGAVLPKLWLAAGAATTLVFTHLVLEHWHYYLMLSPAIAMLCGSTVAWLEELWPAGFGWRRLWPGLGGLALLLGSIQGLNAMKLAIDLDPYPKDVAALVARHTQPTDKLLLYQCDPTWGGELLFLSQRAGLSVMELERRPNGPSPKGLFDLLRNPEDLKRLRQLGFNKLVLVSESPVRHAVEAAKPGRPRQRRVYPADISPQVNAWPEVLRTENVLIRAWPEPVTSEDTPKGGMK